MSMSRRSQLEEENEETASALGSDLVEHVLDGAGSLRPTLADEAYRELKRRIVMLELAPGSQFREADVASTLGLGKTPVREALLRLRLEGLVHVQSRSGYRVAPITLKSARSVCELRALLEGEAAYRVSFALGGALDHVRSVEE